MGIFKLDYTNPTNKLVTQKICLLFLIGVSVISLLLSFIVTYFAIKDGHRSEEFDGSLSDDYIRNKLLENVDSVQIGNWLNDLTKEPQLAGTPADLRMAQYVRNEWHQMGLDANIVSYNVLLSYINATKPNVVKKVAENGTVLFTSRPTEDPLTATPEEIDYYANNPPFLAYSPPTPVGHPVRGELVYVNYGRAQDFDTLWRLGVNVSGKIVIARYSKIFRGNIVKFAEDYGAIGVIIYSDPFDYTGGDPSDTYPRSVYLPPTGVQRGSIVMRDGDPLTPVYPSINSAYRIPIENAFLPKIPAHCLSYSDAEQLLKNLVGPGVADAGVDWKGGLNVSYNIGPGYGDGASVTLEVNAHFESSTINNVIAVIRGCVEPDRYVLVGNHRDSWSFGSVDPHSGTAAMLALSRAVSAVMTTENWCPRRSIVFGSWSGEEYALIGSNEWVQQNHKTLVSQAVAYINVDMAVMGNYSLSAGATPLLFETLWSAAKVVPNPDSAEIANGRNTVYDTWKFRNPWSFAGQSTARVRSPSGSSDYRPFLQLSGVPVIDLWHACDAAVATCNPNYHSMYETYRLQDDLVDRQFLVNKAVAQVWTELVRSLSDSVLLPYSIDYYPIVLQEAVKELTDNYNYTQIFQTNNITLDNLISSVNNFAQGINEFTSNLKNIDLKNSLMVRRANDALMLIERAFVDEKGLPLNRANKHVIIAPSALDSYSESKFPGLHDFLSQYMEAVERGDESGRQAIAAAMKQHLSVIIYHVNAANKFIRQYWF